MVAARVWLFAGFHPVEDPSLVSAIALCLLVALAAHLYAVEVYHPLDAVERLGRLGFRLGEAASHEDAVRRLRAALHRVMVPGTLGLCALALAPWIAGDGLDLPPDWSRMCGLDALVLAAAGLHLRQQVSSRRPLAGREVTPVVVAETRFELDLAADVLRRGRHRQPGPRRPRDRRHRYPRPLGGEPAAVADPDGVPPSRRRPGPAAGGHSRGRGRRGSAAGGRAGGVVPRGRLVLRRPPSRDWPAPPDGL